MRNHFAVAKHMRIKCSKCDEQASERDRDRERASVEKARKGKIDSQVLSQYVLFYISLLFCSFSVFTLLSFIFMPPI